MPAFNGFPDGKVRLIPVPAPFFSDLLPEIDHLGELKVVLYALWRVDHMEGTFRCLRREDFAGDEQFMQGLAARKKEAAALLDESLERASGRGALLKATLSYEAGEKVYYFINTPRGRAAVDAIRAGKWRPGSEDTPPVTLALERPNIFRLYEQHIGPLTPMIADSLRDAEGEYDPNWIEEAIRLAVENNKRNWRYVQAILKRWKAEGRDEQNRGKSEKDRRKYIEGDYADFIEH